MKWLLMSAYLTAAAAPASSDVLSRSYDAKDLETLKVSNTSGQIQVKASTDGKATVVARKIVFEKGCDLKIQTAADALIVTVKDNSSFFRHVKCQVDLEVSLPQRFDLDLDIGSGDINVSGTKGRIAVRTGSGHTTIDAWIDDFIGKCGSGSIKAKGLSGNADVKLGSGNTELTYRDVPKLGSLKVKSGSGDTSINLPAAAKIQTIFSAGSGRVSNEFSDTKDSTFSVAVATGSGNLAVRKTL